MELRNITPQEHDSLFMHLDKYIQSKYGKPVEKFIHLGTQVLRVLVYAQAFLGHMEKQLAYSLQDSASDYDATLVVWQEDDFEVLKEALGDVCNPKKHVSLRVQALINKKYGLKDTTFAIYDDSCSKFHKILDIALTGQTAYAFNKNTRTYYYAAKDLDPEEFIKEGHIFIHIFHRLLKTPSTNIVHGAVVGWGGQGVLFCARGQRGKSTLTVRSMMEGFEYVSDDYLVLEKSGGTLYSYPIYSIITLSPKMYNQLYTYLEGTRFVSNNARKDKYVINISNFHNQFKTKYPIKLCIFPEITSKAAPEIKLCSPQEKQRAIVQLIQSTVSQMQDANDTANNQKLHDMVADLEFYKLDLSADIAANTRLLKTFLQEYTFKADTRFEAAGKYLDITYGIANIYDAQTGTIYTMSPLATWVFENLSAGVEKDKILTILTGLNPAYEQKLHTFAGLLEQMQLLGNVLSTDKDPVCSEALLQEAEGGFSFVKFEKEKILELL